MSFKFKKAKKDPSVETGITDFNRFVGTTADLYYCGHFNQFQLGAVIFEAVEDENDGYRSSLGHVDIISRNAPLRLKLATVRVNRLDDGNRDVYQLIDTEDKHIWLEFGTVDYDDYYPCFVFNTTPK